MDSIEKIIIVDIYELASILKSSHHTLKKNWRKFPHFFIGDGRNLKGARFDLCEVIQHLKEEARYVSMEKFKKKSLDCQVQTQQQAIQKGGFRDKAKGTGMGGRKTRRASKSAGTGTDPFGILSGIDKIS